MSLRTGYRSYPFSFRQCCKIDQFQRAAERDLKSYTLNQLFKSLCLFSGFRSPWSLSNKDDKTENGAVSLFGGGGGKLTSTSLDAALIGVEYEG